MCQRSLNNRPQIEVSEIYMKNEHGLDWSCFPRPKPLAINDSTHDLPNFNKYTCKDALPRFPVDQRNSIFILIFFQMITMSSIGRRRDALLHHSIVIWYYGVHRRHEILTKRLKSTNWVASNRWHSAHPAMNWHSAFMRDRPKICCKFWKSAKRCTAPNISNSRWSPKMKFARSPGIRPVKTFCGMWFAWKWRNFIFIFFLIFEILLSPSPADSNVATFISSNIRSWRCGKSITMATASPTSNIQRIVRSSRLWTLLALWRYFVVNHFKKFVCARYISSLGIRGRRPIWSLPANFHSKSHYSMCPRKRSEPHTDVWIEAIHCMQLHWTR